MPAKPLTIARHLDAVATDHAVFERDQVLNEKQLNSLTEYLDDQSRLTRTQLLGVGVLGGLWPSLGKESLIISKGVGVTTDGDVLGLADDTRYDRWLPYDEAAPVYDRFYDGDKRLPLIELLPADDRRDGKPLADLANSLPGMVAILFMESYINDPDLCTGGDCDNRGCWAKNTRRVLLLDKKVADKLVTTSILPTGTQIARLLPRAKAMRADLDTGSDASVDIKTAEIFIGRYQAAAKRSFDTLLGGVKRLEELLARRRSVDLPPMTNWVSTLEARLADAGKVKVGIQYLHAHAKDLVAAWNELREALFADDGVLCPAADVFPKHLLLGVLGEPQACRTEAYPAPWLAGSSTERQRVAYLMRRFAALLAAFELPKAQRPKITPSRRESAPLSERAIPIYYKADDQLRSLWNETRQKRGETEDTLGYHWLPGTVLTPPLPALTSPEPAWPDPFVDDVGGYDFFRIEGFLGLKADIAEPAIEKLVRQRNLPIAVLSAVVHNDRLKVIRGPKFRRTSLHGLHYLLRQDLASHIKDNLAYSKALGDTVKSAQVKWVEEENRKLKVGAPLSQHEALTRDYTVTLGAAHTALANADERLIGKNADGVLSQRSYKGFMAKGETLSPSIGSLIVGSAKAKIDIGDLARNDVISPLDAFAGSKSHLWVDWLGDLLKKREDDAKDRLLLTNLLRANPGLEHAGGVVPGGTFVLVYDDSGSVIGDLMLPYWIDDNDESDLTEPELKLPDISIRLPVDVPPIKVIKPIGLAFDDFKVMNVLPEINIQTNYSKFFKESLDTLSGVLKNTNFNTVGTVTTPGKDVTGDAYVAELLDRMENTRGYLQRMRGIKENTTLPKEVRDKADEQVKILEADLAGTVTESVRYFAIDAAESVRFETDKTAFYDTVGRAAAEVKGDVAGTKLKTDMLGLNAEASKISVGSSALVAGQTMVKLGFR